MQNELQITCDGILYAKEKYGIVFSNEAIKWIINQGFSYNKG